MAENKLNPIQREALLVRIAELYLAGRKQSEISAETGLHQSNVSRYLKKLQARWQLQAAEAIDTKKARELARIDQVEREYWEAWERSKQDAVTETVENAGTIHVTHVRKGQAGEARFLAGVMSCIEMRLKIIGGFAPVEVTWREELAKHGVDEKRAGDAFEAMVRAAAATLEATDGSGGPGGSGTPADNPNPD